MNSLGTMTFTAAVSTPASIFTHSPMGSFGLEQTILHGLYIIL